MVKEHKGLWDSGADCGEVCTTWEYTKTRELIVHFRASLVAQTVKNLPEMQETWVQSLGREDPPGKRNGYPLQCSCLENPIGQREAPEVPGHRITKS